MSFDPSNLSFSLYRKLLQMPRRQTAKQLHHTAVHEAGHAVIGRILGMTCGGATIVPDWETMAAGVSFAFVERSVDDWDARGRWRPESMLRARIMMLMAGREGEIVLLGRHCGGDADDQREIYCTLDNETYGYAYAGDHSQRWLKRLRARTRHLVRRHRNAIERVTAALLEHNELTPEAIDALVRQDGTYVPARIDRARHSADLWFARAQVWAEHSPLSGRSDWWERVVVAAPRPTSKRVITLTASMAAPSAIQEGQVKSRRLRRRRKKPVT
jgi:hypothetical protein